MEQLLESLDKLNTLVQTVQLIKEELKRLREVKSEEEWEQQSSSEWGLLLDYCSDLEYELE
jgi:hypothetical protein